MNRPAGPICTNRAVFLYVPAFQAGCRGFESRLPLHGTNRLFAGPSRAR